MKDLDDKVRIIKVLNGNEVLEAQEGLFRVTWEQIRSAVQ